MNILRSVQLLLVLNSLLCSYVDNDIDGVDDAVDLCPDTSFDQLVDVNGCPENQVYHGLLTLQIANEINFDEFSTRDNNYNFFSNYQYHPWNLSVSNSQQTNIDSAGDIYINVGYNFSTDALQNKILLGTKIAQANELLGTGENDYATALHLNYTISKKQTLFTHLNYSLNGDSLKIDYKNTLGYTLGTSYLLTPDWYSMFSYDYAQSIYTQGVAYQAVSLFSSYKITNDFFASINYTQGVDTLSYKHSLSFGLGVNIK